MTSSARLAAICDNLPHSRRGDWAILVFHDILKRRTAAGETSIATHDAVLRWLASQPVWCAPMGQVLDHIAAQPA